MCPPSIEDGKSKKTAFLSCGSHPSATRNGFTIQWRICCSVTS